MSGFLGRVGPVERRVELRRLAAELGGKRVKLVIARHRDTGREEYVGRLICWAVPAMGSVSDLVVIQRDGFEPVAYSSSIVVSIEAA